MPSPNRVGCVCLQFSQKQGRDVVWHIPGRLLTTLRAEAHYSANPAP